MARVRLIHWNQEEAAPRVEQLCNAGHEVDFSVPRGPEFLKSLKSNPPEAIVIDLTRLPSHGRDLALAIRSSQATRMIPLVFADGAPEKVERVKQVLPDATYVSWRGIKGAVKRALKRVVSDPVVPASSLAGYSGTSLPKKLGIKSGQVVILVGAPSDFETTLGKLPQDVTIRRQARGRAHLVIWFCQKRADYLRRLKRISELSPGADLWVAWPKASSGKQTDLKQAVVRNVGLATGLVDYKICAIDATWSALRFTRRRTL